jgi:hypothetical protein
MYRLIVLPAMLVAAVGSDKSLGPWGKTADPTDVQKRHVEKVAAGRHVYVVRQGGTMDGTNCRSPIGVGMMDGPALEQTWESNRAVRLENIGETDVINPWLSNGRNNFRNLPEIVAAGIKPGMTDREKARALWFQEIRHRYHWSGDNNELGDPVKVFNVYGHNTCGNDSICLAGLWKQAGLKVSPARVVGHCVTQCFFDGRWNLFDGDMHSMYLLRDNRTVACEQDLVRDHDLIRRSHTQGILNPDRRANDEWEASIYMYEGPPAGDRNSARDTTMNMVLRPGEAITWCWGHTEPVKYHGEKPRYPDTICNGRWEYRPDFSRESWQKGTASIVDVAATGGELTADAGKVGAIVWVIRSPYVLVGGSLEAEATGANFALSWDGKTWHEAGMDLDRFFPPDGPARYEYRLRCELPAGTRLKRLGIVNDIQMAPLALPAMAVGDNTFVYTDHSPGQRQVRITHDWVERSASRPPAAPTTPHFPTDNAAVEGTRIVFRWQAPKDSGGDAIVDYHFELSDRSDMAWPLSTNFYKLISNTADRGKAQYTVPHDGLLAVDQKYYWRVRAKNVKGVWGPWSASWSFTPRGPAAPIDVALDNGPDAGLLRWKPNPIGRKPAKYRIYGSDEKGFTISDEPYKAVVGISKEVLPNRPANFLREVTGTRLPVIGFDVDLPIGSLAYFRVVAVDGQGNRSGPSDFAEASRPMVWSRPVKTARVGSEYRYAVGVVRSLGDLRTRMVDGKEIMNYWDIEHPRFTLQEGPAWLKLDERTGLLSGIPDSPGKVAVRVTVTIDREVRKLDERALSWGQEKVLATSRQVFGTATHTFTVEVAPR